MKNYLRADFGRIMRSLKRWILTLLIFGAFGGILYFFTAETEELTSIVYVNTAESVLSALIFVMSLIDYMVVIGDDFRAKTMQTAIGRGVSRMQVVWAKIIMIAFFLLMDILLLGAIVIGMSYIPAVALSMGQIGEIFLYGLTNGFIYMGYVLFSLPFAFFTQNSAIGFFSYAVFSMGIVKQILELILSMVPVIKDMNLEEYFYSYCTSALQARIMVGGFEPFYLGAILLWLLVVLFVTWILFRKKELEF